MLLSFFLSGEDEGVQERAGSRKDVVQRLFQSPGGDAGEHMHSIIDPLTAI